MYRPSRQPRAVAIARPLAGARMMRDLARDWQRWTPAERAAARLIAVLAAALCLGQALLAG
ncbi:MAG TPA: hypothetical protein VEI03_07145 [Stellaceae bacterium]|nr:hypothetical protein [Stellaceae bacterium]